MDWNTGNIQGRNPNPRTYMGLREAAVATCPALTVPQEIYCVRALSPKETTYDMAGIIRNRKRGKY
jgi:hypothetical protein